MLPVEALAIALCHVLVFLLMFLFRPSAQAAVGATDHISLSSGGSAGTRRRAPAPKPPKPVRASKALPKAAKEPKPATLEEEILAPGTWEKVLGWLVKLGIPKRALPDVGQEVFEAAWRSRKSFDPAKARPERWLNGVAVHVATHHRDKAVQRREMLTLDEKERPEEIDETPNAEEVIELEERKYQVIDVLQDLDPSYRHVMVAYYLDGITMKEIADGMGIPLSTAYNVYYRARAAFATAWQEAEKDEDGEEG